MALVTQNNLLGSGAEHHGTRCHPQPLLAYASHHGFLTLGLKKNLLFRRVHKPLDIIPILLTHFPPFQIYLVRHIIVWHFKPFCKDLTASNRFHILTNTIEIWWPNMLTNPLLGQLWSEGVICLIYPVPHPSESGPTKCGLWLYAVATDSTSRIDPPGSPHHTLYQWFGHRLMWNAHKCKMTGWDWLEP